MRPRKPGIDYFPLDVDMDSDDKIQCLIAEHGIEAFGVLVLLLMRIYRDGYFTKWREPERLLFCRRSGIELETLDSIVSGAVKWDFFDRNLLENHQILTSRGIQRRYLQATKRRGETEFEECFDLLGGKELSSTETRVNVRNNPAKGNGNKPRKAAVGNNGGYGVRKPGLTSTKSTQSTVQYSTVQERDARAHEGTSKAPKKNSKEQQNLSPLKSENKSRNKKRSNEIDHELREGVFLSLDARDLLEEELETGELDYWLDTIAEKPDEVKRLYRDVPSIVRRWRLNKLEDGKLWSASNKHYLPKHQVKPENNNARPQPPLFVKETAPEGSREIPDDIRQKIDEITGTTPGEVAQ